MKRKNNHDFSGVGVQEFFWETGHGTEVSRLALLRSDTRIESVI